MWLMTPARSEQARDMCDTEAQTAARAGSAVLMDARRRIPHPRKDKAARVGHPNGSGDRGWPTRHENAQSSEQGSIELQGEIRSIRSEIRMLATQVSGVPLKNAKAKRAKRTLKRIALDAEKRLRILSGRRPIRSRPSPVPSVAARCIPANLTVLSS